MTMQELINSTYTRVKQIPIKDKMILLSLFLTTFFIRTIPRFLVANWLAEEEYVYMVVESLLGNNPQYAGFYPSLTQRFVVSLSLGGIVNPEIIAKLINPFFAALTIIPIYFLVRRYLTKNQSYTVTLFWAFSEASFYRTSSFTSTETISFFFAIVALVVYQRAKTKYRFGISLVFLGLSVWSHVLPALFVIGTIFIHKFLFSDLKGKIVGSCLIVGFLLLLFSPLSPHLRMINLGNPLGVFGSLSIENLSIYSALDLFFGIKIFLGLTILLLLSIPTLLLKPKNNKVMFSFLIVSILVFLFSWVSYSPQVFAPPRLTFYFVVPLSYYTVLTIWKLTKSRVNKFNWRRSALIGIVIAAMISSIIVGIQPMLWTKNSMTRYEYQALQDNQDLITDVYDWWSDYPVRIAITRLTITYLSADSPVNETKAISDSELWENYNATVNNNSATNNNSTTNDSTTNNSSTTNGNSTNGNNTTVEEETPKSPFKYVFYSKRMSEEGMMIVYVEGGRTNQIREPIPDIWKNSSWWKVIYENEEVKIYEFLGDY